MPMLSILIGAANKEWVELGCQHRQILQCVCDN